VTKEKADGSAVCIFVQLLGGYMRKSVLLLALFMLMICNYGVADEWSGFISGAITNGSTVIHQSAHPFSEPVASLMEGDTVLLLDAYGNWYYIITPTSMLKGWIRRENFRWGDASAIKPRSGLVLCETLTLRENPTTNGKRLATLSTHQQVLILEEFDDWYYVQLDKPSGTTKGYVLKDFVTADYSSRIVVDSPLHAYAAPSLDSKKVALIDVNTRIFIVDTFDEFWVVSLRGASAFVSMRDLQIEY